MGGGKNGGDSAVSGLVVFQTPKRSHVVSLFWKTEKQNQQEELPPGSLIQCSEETYNQIEREGC